MNEVDQWLTRVGFAAYIPYFRAQQVRADQLPYLSDLQLQQMGIADEAHRRGLLNALGQLSGPTEHTSPNAALPLSLGSDDSLAGQTFVSGTGPAIRSGFGSAPPSSPRSGSGLQPSPFASGSQSGAFAVAPAAAAPQSGQRLAGRYYLMKELGRGAMGVVFKAVDEVTQREVAIKVVSPASPAGAGAAIELLLKEAAMAQELSHPNLLRVNHVEGGETPFIVMEYIDGDTLTTHWHEHQRRYSHDELAEILKQILQGLGYLHGRKLIHRDIKPDNILIAKTGEVKITDYGVATTLKEQISASSQAGTLFFMAPEQLSDKKSDARSDLYAVGIMAHQLLTGKLPMAGSDPLAVQEWHLRGERTLPLLGHDGLAQVIRRLVAIDPAERFASANEVLAALEGKSVPTQPVWSAAPHPGVAAAGERGDGVELQSAPEEAEGAGGAERVRTASSLGWAALGALTLALAGAGWWFTREGAASDAPPSEGDAAQAAAGEPGGGGQGPVARPASPTDPVAPAGSTPETEAPGDPESLEDAAFAFVETHNAPLRTKQSLKASTLKKLAVGTRCAIEERESDWLKLRCEGVSKSGFARREHLAAIAPDPQKFLELAELQESPGRKFTYMLRAYKLDRALSDLLPQMKALYVDSQFLVLENKRATPHEPEVIPVYCDEPENNDDCLSAALELGDRFLISRQKDDFAVIDMRSGKVRAVEYFGRVVYHDRAYVEINHKTTYKNPSDVFDWLF